MSSSKRAQPKVGAPRPPKGDTFRTQLEADKHESTLQVLFKVTRLVEELALSRIAAQRDAPKLRRSHTSLFPHIDLDGTRITDLAERLGVSKQAASQLVDDLEGLGVLARVADPEDGRGRRVVFTELGRRGLLQGLETLRALEQELADDIGEKRMAQMRAALLAIHHRLTPRSVPP